VIAEVEFEGRSGLIVRLVAENQADACVLELAQYDTPCWSLAESENRGTVELEAKFRLTNR
jgi:hypothetical protein